MFNAYLYLEIIKLKLLTALVGRWAIPRSELVDLILGGQLEHTVHTGLDNLGGKVAWSVDKNAFYLIFEVNQRFNKFLKILGVVSCILCIFSNYPEVSNLLTHHLWNAVPKSLANILHNHVFLKPLNVNVFFWDRGALPHKGCKRETCQRRHQPWWAWRYLSLTLQPSCIQCNHCFQKEARKWTLQCQKRSPVSLAYIPVFSPGVLGLEKVFLLSLLPTTISFC